MKVLLIVPSYNEEENVLDNYKRIINYNKKNNTNYDVIIINDGSCDKTEDICINNDIPHISLVNNLGIGGAVQTGYKYAFYNNYDIAVQFDGDGQHDANYIDKIVEPIKKGEANLVIGSRFIGEESEFKSTATRRLGINILSGLYKIITGKQIKDMTSGFRAADKSIIEIFSNNYPHEYPEPVTNLAVSNKKIVEVPVKMKERKHGKSSITPFKSMYYMINVILYFFIIFISKGDDHHA